jgi:hypothetical protein
MKNIRCICVTILVFLLFDKGYGQESQDGSESLQDLKSSTLSKYLSATTVKAGKIEDEMDRKTMKAFNEWQKMESKIQQRLSKLDSSKAREIISNSKERFSELQEKLKKTNSLNQYIPSLDSISTSLNFLNENPTLLSNIRGYREKIDKAMASVKGLQQQFQKTEDIKDYLKERREYMQEQLTKLGFARELKKMNKQVYYLSSRINDYKEVLKDHQKAESKALKLLSKIKPFRDFMHKNSQLAALFRLPGDPNDPTTQAGLAGLQTRAQVNGLIQQQLAIGGPSAQQQFQQNILSAQDQLTELKNKVTQFGQSSSDAELPQRFKPNNQKTKTILQRLEFGTNLQSQKANGYFPVTSDIGLSLGYKLNDKSILGVGASYKMGWGQNIRNINITHQGIGLRSFVDWKIKGSFWVSGGYEMNYLNEFNRVSVLKDLNAWQQSGLVGISKVVSLKTKFFKKTKLQLMWDFLSYEQVPRTQPVVFRIGYSIK